MGNHIVFFDFETGGLTPSHPNIQLAAIAVDITKWEQVDSFEAKIQFDESDCDPKALSVNSYEAADWLSAKKESIVIRDFVVFVRNYCDIKRTSRTGSEYFVARPGGHNIVGFDLQRLHDAAKRHGIFMPVAFDGCDTLQLAHWYFLKRPRPANFRLGTLCQHFGIETPNAHDAMGDVISSAALAERLLNCLEGGKNV